VVAGGKRPFHTIIPGFLTKDGKPQMSFGVMGGNMQPQGHLQTMVRMLVHGQNPQAACDAPRWKVATGLKIDLEHTMARRCRRACGAGPPVRGQQRPYMDYGSGQFIWRLRTTWKTATWPPAIRAATGRRRGSEFASRRRSAAAQREQPQARGHQCPGSRLGNGADAQVVDGE
jgi:gamma-glutamyltranspeptidase